MGAIPSKTRALVYQRDGDDCARCSRTLMNVPSSVHHRLPRRMGGTSDVRSNDPRNLIRICGTGTTECHGWVESHRLEALAHGWLIESYDDLCKPLRTLWGAVIHLYADGERVDTWGSGRVPVSLIDDDLGRTV